MVYPEIYDVHDVIVPERHVATIERPGDEEPLSYDYQSLADTVTSTVAPTTWEQSGPGEGASYLGTVTWVQTQEVHAEISDLLAKLRQVHRGPITPLVAKAPEPAQPAVDPDALQLRVYKLSWSRMHQIASEPSAQACPDVATSYTQQIGEAIVSLIDRPSWEQHGGQGTLRVVASNEPRVAGILMVRHTTAAHKQIAKLLRDLDAPSGFGFGGHF